MTATLRLASPPRPPLLAEDSGPGLRWLLFLQGCARPCTRECLNPAFLDPRRGLEVPMASLLFLVDQLAAGAWGPVEGLTVLGGEPTDQAAPLLGLLTALRSQGLSVMLYSGRPLAWFSTVPAAAALLPHVDILVDGPFLPSEADASLRWRGSRNQRILRLSDRYDEAALTTAMEVRGVTAHLRPGAPSALSGLQSRAAASLVEGELQGSFGEVA